MKGSIKGFAVLVVAVVVGMFAYGLVGKKSQ